MKKDPELDHYHHHLQQQRDLEILKAVAQAWYSHSGNSRPISEFDARRRNFEGKPSRFHPQALTTRSSTMEELSVAPAWDFNQSLWDSYELVTVSRRLETALGLDTDDPFSASSLSRFHRRRRQESKNSLRNLFNQMSSRRFKDKEVPRENNT
ncbi:uncharacterized protein LOC129307674 [Prosopis cineraria]|uniref:uncharacterized protein LOC129307674 n=1 Tax=Prosopis cineraria TaxID=364024 RepID=UPI00240F88C1|nr:uncharacterized protein LOC129307674 [Prosopis cineraria]